MQDGKRIDTPDSSIEGVPGNTLSEEYCKSKAEVFEERDRFNEEKVGGWASIQEALRGEWVLAMSIRDDVS